MSRSRALFRLALYSRSTRVKRWGSWLSALVLLAIVVAMTAVPYGASLGLLLVVPVAGIAWFGGPEPGRAAAFTGAAAQVVAGAVAGISAAGHVLTGFVAFAVLWIVAGVVPGLRFASQAYREQAHTDPLTKLGNRRFFHEVATVELGRTRRYRRPLSLVYMDANGFERYAHTAGPVESEALLARIASQLTGGLRASDVVARISGAEFAILLPETPGAGARVVADKLRQRLTAAIANEELSFRAAVVGFDEGPASVDAMLRQADEAMAEARRSGTGQLAYRDYAHPPLELA